MPLGALLTPAPHRPLPPSQRPPEGEPAFLSGQASKWAGPPGLVATHLVTSRKRFHPESPEAWGAGECWRTDLNKADPGRASCDRPRGRLHGLRLPSPSGEGRAQSGRKESSAQLILENSLVHFCYKIHLQEVIHMYLSNLLLVIHENIEPNKPCT